MRQRPSTSPWQRGKGFAGVGGQSTGSASLNPDMESMVRDRADHGGYLHGWFGLAGGCLGGYLIEEPARLDQRCRFAALDLSMPASRDLALDGSQMQGAGIGAISSRLSSVNEKAYRMPAMRW